MFSRLLIAISLFVSPAAADVWTFRTPSGNIGCSVGEGHSSIDIICTIRQRSQPAHTPELASCPVSQAITVEMLNRGFVRASCTAAPARAFNDNEVARYGVTSDLGGIVCQSTRKGLRCTNQDGHGFFLSRAVQQVY